MWSIEEEMKESLKDYNGTTPVHRLCYKIELAREDEKDNLINKLMSDNDVNKLQDRLIECCKNDINIDNEISSILSKLRIDEIRNTKNKEGLTPLMFSALKGNLSLVELLISSGCSVSSKDFSNNTALFYAVKKRNNVEIITLLLSLTDDVNIKNNWNSSPLIMACDRGSYENARVLLESGANVNHRDDHFTYPLLVSNSEEIVELLYEFNVDDQLLTRESKSLSFILEKKFGKVKFENIKKIGKLKSLMRDLKLNEFILYCIVKSEKECEENDLGLGSIDDYLQVSSFATSFLFHFENI